MAVQTLYYEFPDGRFGQMETTQADPTAPPGATLLDEEAYAVRLSQWRADQDQDKADVRAAEAAQKKGAYDALIAANFDPAVASTLSGYTPPSEPEETP
ncbi:hypothetical protein SUDANB1_05690 [Streptomyces sp. enrichment culture]|uniref:hypothetical protein n=1 Tax=Streptomyces sp. enrichment culture TaxID=1795815 RepID=UPI003F570DD4